MILYHASSLEVPHPDISFSRNALDFGKGFYLTLLKEQAVKYGRRFIDRGRNAYLNIYELNLPSDNKYVVRNFPKYDEEWLEFVSKCRLGETVEEYDIVSGGIANDKVFNTLDLYFDGLINKKEALGRLAFEHPNHQICILKQEIIDECLYFIKSVKL